MPTPPDSTKASLEHRPAVNARQRWPNIELAVRHRAGFAYADARLPDGDVLRQLWLRYGGAATHWRVALYRPSTRKYEDQAWFTGTPVEALDFAGDVLLIAADV